MSVFLRQLTKWSGILFPFFCCVVDQKSFGSIFCLFLSLRSKKPGENTGSGGNTTQISDFFLYLELKGPQFLTVNECFQHTNWYSLVVFICIGILCLVIPMKPLHLWTLIGLVFTVFPLSGQQIWRSPNL